MLWIIKWIGTILLWTGWTEDGDDGDTHSGSQVHRTAIVADEERAAFELSRQLSKTGFACDTFDAALRHIESLQQVCIQRRVVRPANQEYLGIQLLHQPSCQFPVAIQRPAFGRQFHAWIAAAARQQCYL